MCFKLVETYLQMKNIKILFESLQERKRPEDIAEIILRTLKNDLSKMH
jgi:hypothetical protein